MDEWMDDTSSDTSSFGNDEVLFIEGWRRLYPSINSSS
jgi:hypothetical protein